MKTIRCIKCYSEFADDEVQGHVCCPNCQSPGIPASISEDFDMRMNWQELRILANWAMNYAIGQPNFPTDSIDALRNMIRRWEQKYRKEDWPALTLAGEVAEIPGAKLIRDGKVEVEGGKVN